MKCVCGTALRVLWNPASPANLNRYKFRCPRCDAVRPAQGSIDIDTGGEDGIVHYRRVAIAETPYGELTLWWIAAYGGGLFLPVHDGTCGDTTYGGGRYLTDSVKGTHSRGLVVRPDGRVQLDFNYLYNPSCAYTDEYLCPLAPPENRVTAPIEAGELTYPNQP